MKNVFGLEKISFQAKRLFFRHTQIIFFIFEIKIDGELRSYLVDL